MICDHLYLQLAMIAPMTIMTTREQAASNSHNLTDLFIQMTSIEVEVTRNPIQSHSAQTMPPQAPVPGRYGDEEANRYITASAYAVTRLDSRFHPICGSMSPSFSFPVMWISANFIHSFPVTGPWNRNPKTKAAIAATSTASRLMGSMVLRMRLD